MAQRLFVLSIITLLLIGLFSITGCKKKVEETPAEIQETEYISPVEEEEPEPVVEEPYEPPIEEEPALTEEEIIENLNKMGVLDDVFFAFDRFDLSPMAKDSLTKNAGWLKQNPTARIMIEGHCDERGTNEYNLALGDRRANAAAAYLTSLGIAENRIETISYGEERPFAFGHDEATWAKNRRAHFVITSK
jgi:peptidoglycan-associated lipoprotein